MQAWFVLEDIFSVLQFSQSIARVLARSSEPLTTIFINIFISHASVHSLIVSLSPSVLSGRCWQPAHV